MYREDDASRRVMDALRRLVSALRTSGAAASFGPGISVAQLFALRVVGGHSGISMGELAKRTLTSPSAVSEVVSRLVAHGFVERDHDSTDHRRVLLRLTPEGRALFSSLDRTLPERLVAALARMDPDQRTTLADAMEDWVSDSGLAEVAPSMFGEGGDGRLSPSSGNEVTVERSLPGRDELVESSRRGRSGRGFHAPLTVRRGNATQLRELGDVDTPEV